MNESAADRAVEDMLLTSGEQWRGAVTHSAGSASLRGPVIEQRGTKRWPPINVVYAAVGAAIKDVLLIRREHGNWIGGGERRACSRGPVIRAEQAGSRVVQGVIDATVITSIERVFRIAPA